MLQVIEALDLEIHEKIDAQLCRSLERIYITGSRDSNFAALTIEYAMESLSSLAVAPISSLQFARYSA